MPVVKAIFVFRGDFKKKVGKNVSRIGIYP